MAKKTAIVSDFRKASMDGNSSKLAGFGLCVASVLLLMLLGRLDLLIVLLPVSLLLGYSISAAQQKNDADRKHKRGVA